MNSKLALCFVALAFFFSFSSERVNGQLVTLTNITRDLCPTNLVDGDREFGRAPSVTITGRLEINPAGSGLVAVINFDARERSGSGQSRDRTQVRQEFRLNVFTAPAGRRITAINGPTTFSRTNFIGSDAGAEFGDCKPGQIAMASGGFIRRIVWVGDTGGDDVASSATSCNCDTKISSIEFNRVRIATTRL